MDDGRFQVGGRVGGIQCCHGWWMGDGWNIMYKMARGSRLDFIRMGVGVEGLLTVGIRRRIAQKTCLFHPLFSMNKKVGVKENETLRCSRSIGRRKGGQDRRRGDRRWCRRLVLRLLLLLSRPHLRLQQRHRPILPLPLLPLPRLLLRIRPIAPQEAKEPPHLFQPHDANHGGGGGVVALAVDEGDRVVEPGVLVQDEVLAEDDGVDAGAEDVEGDCDGRAAVRGVGEAPVDLDLAEDVVPAAVGVFDVLFARGQRGDGRVEALGVVDGHQVGFAARVEGGDGFGVVDASEDELAEAFVLSGFVDAFAEEVVGSGAGFGGRRQLETVSVFAHGFRLS